MRVVFNEKDVGYECVEYIEYIYGHKSQATLDTNFEGRMQTRRYGMASKKWCLV